MNTTDILNNLTRTVHKIGFKAKKHSPEILVMSGIVGTVASAVLACKATTKVGDVLDQTKEEIHGLHLVAEAVGIEMKSEDTYTDEDREMIDHIKADGTAKDYTEEDLKKDTVIIYTQTAVKFAKLYGPAVLLGAVSIASILAGHNILRKRNVAIMAAYTAVDKGFKEYRSRVVERFGKEVDNELRHNVKAQEIETTTVDENGKETTVTETVKAMDPNQYSDYAKIFDESCAGWTKDPEKNLMFIKLQQAHANDKLQAEGVLFLNDVYAMLGFPKTSAGQVVGWIYDEECPNGDNYVDFGIYDVDRPKARDFVNGYERSIVLDFNPDGIIYDKL